jgi:hypothetical protein
VKLIAQFRLQPGLTALALLVGSMPALPCVEGDLRGEAVTIEREVGPTAAGKEAAIQVLGAGWFHAAEVVKRGGSTDNTYVTLELDGKQMVSASFANLKNQWNQLATPYIVMKVQTAGDTDTMTIWYAPELKFRGIAALRIEVQEDGVNALRMRTVMNKPAPHEHLPGQPGTALALPAFK